MPAEIADKYTEVPTALWKHGGALGLDAETRLLVVVMWSFRYYAHSTIHATPSTLAERSGLAVKTVRRRIAALVEMGYLRVERKGTNKYAPVGNYNLDPLWIALAHAAREHRALKLVQGGQAADQEGGPTDQQGGQRDQPRVDSVTTEVEEEKKTKGSTTPGRAPAHDTAITLDPYEQSVAMEAKLRRDAMAPDVRPWTAAKLMQEARFEADRREGRPIGRTLSAGEERSNLIVELMTRGSSGAASPQLDAVDSVCEELP